MNRLRIAAAAILFASSLAALPERVTAQAAITSVEDGKRKINLSGRQRMLSQRMAKAACFAALGIDVPGHLVMAQDAHALFDVTLRGLRRGDSSLGMLPEHAPAVLAELDRVDTLWIDYGAAIDRVVRAGAVDPDLLARVAALSVPTLVQMDVAVAEFEKRYGSTQLHPSLALALNVSGRQRMLTQKASKEFCLVAYGSEVEANRTALAATVDLFDRSLAALTDGDYEVGLPEPPTDELRSQLALVRTLWVPLLDVFRATAAGATPDARQIALIAAENNDVLREMNRVVEMYEAL